MWDTHANNNPRVKSVLCPQFDVGFSALIEDLESRGLLDETLVVAAAEFGRTPKFNAQGGRDHWGHVFSLALAGAGIAGGQVYGASDANGAYPLDGRTQPEDLAATIFHLLGVGHNATMLHPNGRPFHICNGKPMYRLLGMNPATSQLREASGDVKPIPDFRPIHAPKKS
jgi:membrane-anchored protein YejM (alkaline phosphatase superfamily)